MLGRDELLDYGVGIVPAGVAWLAAWLSVAVGSSEGRASSAAELVLIRALVVVTA
jgi:hypothetical protein